VPERIPKRRTNEQRLNVLLEELVGKNERRGRREERRIARDGYKG
jgi:hypothetical protein